MHRKTLRLPSRFSAVIPSDPDIALPAFDPEPAPAPMVADTIPDIVLPPTPPTPPKPTIEETLAETLQSLNRAVAEIRIGRSRETATATRAIVDLVVAATRHLVGRKIQAGEYDFEGMIGQALRKLDPQSAVVVRMNADDLHLLQSKSHNLSARDGIAWEADASLTQGSFRVQANDISLWSDLETRLDEVRDALEQSLEAADATRDDELVDEEAA